MMTRPYSKSLRAASYLVAILLSSAFPLVAGVAVPDWLRQAAAASLPAYPPETEAVKLLDEQITTVNNDGQVVTFNRRAYKILRPGGKDVGDLHVPFTPETKINFIRGWSITARAEQYEVGDKDAIESNWFNDSADYTDVRVKMLTIPGHDVGSVVGYEYEQRERPHFNQDVWYFQSIYPVVKSKFTIRIPPGWEYRDQWTNYVSLAPTRLGENVSWELQNIPGIENEDDMPPTRAIAGRMVITYFPAQGNAQHQATWDSLGRWYASLAIDRLKSSPDLTSRVAALTTGLSDPLARISALAAFAQRDVRYVAVEIGIGGWQPHAATEILKNRFGDCKDKATLFNAMLKEIGVDAYYVVINTDRGVVREEVPSVTSFDHVISAIKLPPGINTAGLYAIYEHPKLGRLLLFDPTAEMVPLGQLPSYLQASKGLLVTPDGGELIATPLLKPETNLLLRIANLELTADGTLLGEVHEVRSGLYAADTRDRLLRAQLSDRAQVVEKYLSGFLGQFRLERAAVSNLDQYDKDLVLSYKFQAPGYAKVTGNLLLIRPRVLGEKGDAEFERKRKYPVQFRHSSDETDTFVIKLPPGYKLDEMPDPIAITNDFVEYNSKVQLAGNVLSYKRNYKVKDVFIPMNRFEDMKAFYRQVAADERNSAVLKKEAQ